MLLIGNLVICDTTNVPSKLCASAHAHSGHEMRALKKAWSAYKCFFQKCFCTYIRKFYVHTDFQKVDGTLDTTSIYLSIYLCISEIYVAPLRGNYSEALPAQAWAKIKVLRSLQNKLDKSCGRERSSDGRLFQAEGRQSRKPYAV